ncbi:MAG: DUF1439 domain-containing protein [Spirochaetales bacterium]|nr:DUF1439 domain-containing protein [Spirochaetales bacterium]
MKKVIIFAAVMALCSCGATLYRVKVSENDVKREMAAFLPYENDFGAGTIFMPMPQVKFEKERIYLDFDAKIRLFQANYNIKLKANGNFRYEKSQGAFYLTGLQVEQLTIEGIAPILATTAENLVKANINFLELYPIYVLNQNDFKESLAKLVLLRTKTEKGRIIFELGI